MNHKFNKKEWKIRGMAAAMFKGRVSLEKVTYDRIFRQCFELILQDDPNAKVFDPEPVENFHSGEKIVLVPFRK